MDRKQNNSFIPEMELGVSNILEKFNILIQEQIEYGFQILTWDSNIDREGISDANLVPILFLRNILEISDGISLLIKSSSITPANILIRTVIENYFYLEHIFEKHFQERCLSYIYIKTINKISLLEKLNPETVVGDAFKKSFFNDKLFAQEVSFDQSIVSIHKRFAIDLLKLKHFQTVEEEYNRIKESKEYKKIKFKQVPWYLLFEGEKNIRQLAIGLKLKGVYDGFYSIHSTNVHSLDVFSGAISKGKNGEAEILQIRIPENAQSLTLQIITMLNSVFKLYIEKRMPNKVPDYLNWQIELNKKLDPLKLQKLITVNF